MFDGDGKVVPDAMIEIWQADAQGRFGPQSSTPTNSAFRGFGRRATDADGEYSFDTIKPGSCRVPTIHARRRTS